MKRRLGIYCFHDASGIVDQYVITALRGLKTVCEEVLFVSAAEIADPGKFSENGLEDLRILRASGRSNLPFLKAALAQRGAGKDAGGEELVLLDDGLMGPVRSLESMFREMDGRENLDFWGLSVHSEPGMTPESHPEEYTAWISSSFAVFRESLTGQPAFGEMLEQVSGLGPEDPDPEGRQLTSFLEEKGFRGGTFLRTPENGAYSPDYLLMDPVDAIRTGNCPFFEKRVFYLPQMRYLAESAGEQPWELIRFLRKETDYDTNQILPHLIRTCHQDDLVRTLRMTYVLPSAFRIPRENPEMDGGREPAVALVMHLYYMDLLKESARYAGSMPETADIYILTGSPEKKPLIEEAFSKLPNRVKIRITQNRGRDVGSFLVSTADLQEKYDLICFYHDKKTRDILPQTAGHSFAYKTAECVLSSRSYVENIIALFTAHPEIGMVSGLTPNHAGYQGLLACEWGNNYENALALARELKLKVPISADHIPAAGMGDVFWYRTRAMAPMFRKSWKYEDFPEEPVGLDGTILHAIERIYPFAVQEAGYLPARAMPEHIAALEMSNLEFYDRAYNQVRLESRVYGDFQTVLEIERERLDPGLAALAQAANLSTQVRLTLKRHLPHGLYSGFVKVKRKLFGPHDIREGADEELDRMLEDREQDPAKTK